MPSPINPVCATNTRSALRCSARYGLVGSVASWCFASSTSEITPPTVSTSAVYRSVLMVTAGPAEAAAAAGAAGTAAVVAGAAGVALGTATSFAAEGAVAGGCPGNGDTCLVAAGGGACSCCHAVQRKNADEKKIA